MEFHDGAALRQIVGAEFTGEVPSVRDGPNVAVPPKAERETDKMFSPPGCLEPQVPAVPKQNLPKNGSRVHVAHQQDDVALRATIPLASQTVPQPLGSRTVPQPSGGYKVETKDCKPREGLTCVHCSLILRNAMQTEDGLRVCLSCLEEVKSKGGSCEDCSLVIEEEKTVSPDFAARKEIENLEVLCRNLGCGWSGRLKLLEEHETRKCDFREVSCHQCAKPIPCNAMKDHVANTCDHRSVDCDYCYTSVKQFQLEDHHQGCSKFRVDCADCHQSVPREELENHWENECEYMQCSVCEEKMLRSAVAEHLKDNVEHFEHFRLLMKQVKHLRVEVQNLQQWLAAAEATMKKKSTSPAISDTSEDALKLIQQLTKRLDIMEEEKASQARDILALTDTVSKQAHEVTALREELRRTNRSLGSNQHAQQHYNSGRSFSAVNQTGEASYNVTFFGEAVNPMHQADLKEAIARIQDQIRSMEHRTACAKSAQQELETRLDKIDCQLQGLSQQSSRNSASGQSSKLFDGVVDIPEATTGELFPSGGQKNGVLVQRVDELERSVSALSVQIADVDLQFQASLVTTYNGQFVWRIPDLSRRIRDAKQGRVTSIYSPPFYTSKSGYKMCIRTYLNGDGMGEKTHLSVFFVIMKGEYDALLPWPFQSRISLLLLNQENGTHITETFRPNPASKSFQRPTSEMNVASGCPRFAALATLSNPAFVKNDVLFIKCSVDTTGLAQL